MPFVQPAPRLGNQYEEDRVLRSSLRRILPAEVLKDVEPTLATMGELAAGELFELQQADRLNEPVHTPWDPWGERIDHIEVTPLWKRAQQVTAEHGVVATGYERKHGRFSRLHQFSLAYLFSPSTDLYGCPLAMTDGATNALLKSGNRKLADRAVPHLTSRDPATFWTSGQWMTESIGGSDAGQSQTVARRGDDGRWRLFGHKSFVSAATAQMALTLARPDGNGPGGRGLALFYLETRDDRGRPQGLVFHRLKDKLGTRKVPTAEVELVGAVAEPVVGLADGTKAISPMLNISRTWNTMFAVATMRRSVALARAYAPLRTAFGALLSEKPLHVDTLAGIQAETEGAFHLFFLVLELLGQSDAGELDDAGTSLLRLATSLAKLTTGKQVVAVASEAMECF
ncbi:MAG: acyl-CoA dehydrogenase family protein, partial [Candidatus Binatia bacterium]